MLRIITTALIAAIITTTAQAQTYQTLGNFTFGSDGSMVERLGNTTIITPPNDPQFGGVTSSFAIDEGLKMFRSILIAMLIACSAAGARAQTWHEGKITSTNTVMRSTQAMANTLEVLKRCSSPPIAIAECAWPSQIESSISTCAA